ncbi:B3 DNA binding domain-containing protein [Artemisia annua]|uniref:B3 DNA binding domain-containing protein n=1 Tax=Artemisia annua TaxID=35608 RepID=A0A2U1LG06_ARTAN|nr:B3 DNA binding domain-containing protein [Artemisia annua]
MSSPAAGDPNPPPPPLQNSDQHPIFYLSDSADNNFTISQLNPSSKTPNPNPNPNPPINSPKVVQDSSSKKSRSVLLCFDSCVYIIRADNLNEVDGALCLLNMEEQMVPEMDMPSPKPKKRKRPKSLPLLEQSGNNSEEVGSEVLEGSKPELSLEEVKTIEDFHIMVKGVCIDSELPDDVRMNYYKLCTAREELLHEELAEGLNHKLVAGMIGETVNIANKIKNCQITTTKGEFETWDNHLKSFSIMGMKVEFLRERIATLSRIVSESEANLDVQKYVEAKREHKRVEDDIQSLTEKLVGLKESSRKFKRSVDGLKEKIEMHEDKLQKQVNIAFKIV